MVSPDEQKYSHPMADELKLVYEALGRMQQRTISAGDDDVYAALSALTNVVRQLCEYKWTQVSP